MKLLALFAALLIPLTAHADCPPSPKPSYVASCKQFTASATGAFDGVSIMADQTMYAYRPLTSYTDNKLILIIHGYGGSTRHFTELQTYAAYLGYYTLSIDADLTLQPDDNPLACPGVDAADCSNRPTDVCGCFTECYEAWNSLINSGVWHDGLADAPNHVRGGDYVYTSVRERVRASLIYLAQHDNAGWAQFMNGNNIVWNKVIGLGESRGSSLIGQLARNNAMDRVLLFSGPDEHLTNSSGTPAGSVGGPEPTYGWGAGGTCSAHVGVPQWISDNDFAGHTGTHWLTRRIFAYDATGDSNWDRNYGGQHEGVKSNVESLGLVPFDIGTPAAPNWSTGTAHSFYSNQPCTTTPADGGHGDTVNDSSACNDSASVAFRHIIWEKMLWSN